MELTGSSPARHLHGPHRHLTGPHRHLTDKELNGTSPDRTGMDVTGTDITGTDLTGNTEPHQHLTGMDLTGTDPTGITGSHRHGLHRLLTGTSLDLTDTELNGTSPYRSGRRRTATTCIESIAINYNTLFQSSILHIFYTDPVWNRF